MTSELDKFDRKILSLLQGNSALTVAQVARKAGLSASPCWRRIGRLEEAGREYGWGEERAFVRAVEDAANRFRILADEAAEQLKSCARVAVQEFNAAAERAGRGGR